MARTIHGLALVVAPTLFLLSACAGEQAPVKPGGARASMIAWLNGRDVVPPGDADGSGSARITLVSESNTICTVLQTSNLSPIDLAHIHRGQPGQNGPALVSVDPPDQNANDDCQLVTRSLLEEIRRNPEVFYVDVHSSEYPRGAIRGQLARH